VRGLCHGGILRLLRNGAAPGSSTCFSTPVIHRDTLQHGKHLEGRAVEEGMARLTLQWQNQLVHRSLLNLALVCMSAFITCESGSARGDESTSFCPRCNVLVGLGTTYRFSAWTDGIVVPLALELDESRWELGAFRFANAQRYGTPS
jgi:hypothetical protein